MFFPPSSASASEASVASEARAEETLIKYRVPPKKYIFFYLDFMICLVCFCFVFWFILSFFKPFFRCPSPPFQVSVILRPSQGPSEDHIDAKSLQEHVNCRSVAKREAGTPCWKKQRETNKQKVYWKWSLNGSDDDDSAAKENWSQNHCLFHRHSEWAILLPFPNIVQFSLIFLFLRPRTEEEKQNNPQQLDSTTMLPNQRQY